jgi:hypothetical protein
VRRTIVKKNVRRLAVAVAVCASSVAGPAHAQSGTNLTWDDCVGSGNESDHKIVACTNSGTFNLLCSFASPVDIPNVAAVDAFMDVKALNGSISPWWSQTGRWTGEAINSTGASCGMGLWSQAPSGPVVFVSVQTVAPNRIRVRTTTVVVPGEEQAVVAGQEYYSHTLQLHFRAGTAEDPGCAAPACFAMADFVLIAPESSDIHIPIPLVQNAVGWQSGFPGQCIFYSPTAKNTWGQIKAIYR